MENYISMLVATLEHLKLVSAKEAEKLDKELRNNTLPGTYREARELIKDAFEKIRS